MSQDFMHDSKQKTEIVTENITFRDESAITLIIESHLCGKTVNFM